MADTFDVCCKDNVLEHLGTCAKDHEYMPACTRSDAQRAGGVYLASPSTSVIIFATSRDPPSVASDKFPTALTFSMSWIARPQVTLSRIP